MNHEETIGTAKRGKAMSLPYMSVFKFEGEKIREWRDYFDLQTILRQLDLPLERARLASGRGSRPSPAPAASGF